MIRLTVVVPVHNEADRLGDLVATFLASLPPAVAGALHEVLLVENGSRDRTLDVCRELERAHPGLVRTLVLARGSYGAAIREGMLAARGTHVGILECDVLDAGFLERALERAAAGARFVVASKRHPDSVDERPLARRVLTWGLNRMVNLLVGYPGSDTHGLKLIEARVAREVCRLAITSDEVFQTEIVVLAWRIGHRIEELPLTLREIRPTPVAIWRRIPMMLQLFSQLRASLRRFRPITVRAAGAAVSEAPLAPAAMAAQTGEAER